MSVFFEHQGLTYELPDGTTPELAKQKIQNYLGKSSLVDQIPDIAPDNSVPSKFIPGTENDLFPKYKEQPSIKETTKHLLETSAALPDTIASVGTALTSGMVGGLLGFYGIADQSSDIKERMSEGARKFTWQPRTEIGQEVVPKILEPTMKVLEPLQGHVAGFAPPLLTKGPGIIGNKVPKIEPVNKDIGSILNKEKIRSQKAKLLELKTEEQKYDFMIKDGSITPEGLQDVENIRRKRIALEKSLYPNKFDNLETTSSEQLIQEQKSLEDDFSLLKKQINELVLEDKEIPNDLIDQYDNISNRLNENKQKIGQSEIQHNDHAFFENPQSVAEKKLFQVRNNPELAIKYREKAIELFDSLSKEPKRNSSMLEALQKEIEAYDRIIKDFEESKKTPKTLDQEIPLKDTERPLEDVKTHEVIPEPTLDKKTAPTEEIVGPVKKTHEQLEEEKRLAFERNQRPESTNTFVDKEQMLKWIQHNIDKITKDIQNVQNAINYARKNNKDTIPYLDRTFSLEELINYREELNKKLETLQNKKTKSLRTIDPSEVLPKTEEELNKILNNEEIPTSNTPKYIAESAIKRLTGIINKYERILNRLRKNIFNRESGTDPSGTPVYFLNGKEYGLDAAKGLEEQLTERYNKLINKRDQIQKYNTLLKQEELRSNPKTDLPKIEESLLNIIEEKKPYNSVEDILLNNPDHPIQGFIDNPHLFQQLDNLDIHIEKAILENHPEIEKTIQTLLHRVGLEKDKIYIITGEGSSNVSFHGNTSLIKINVKQIPEMMKVYSNDLGGKSTLFKKLFVGSSEKAMYHYTMAKIISHEMGHIVFTKWLKFGEVSKEMFEKLILDFETWKKNNKIEPTTFLNTKDLNVYKQYFSVFDEFFAERVTDTILHDSLLSSFSDRRFSLNKQIQQLVSNVKDYLLNIGIKINPNFYKQNLINNIIFRNKEEIKKSGRTIWEKMETEQNDKLLLDNPNRFPFANKTLSEIRENPYEVLKISKDGLSTKVIPWQRHKLIKHPDIVNFSNKALIALGNSAPWLARKFFGKTTFAQIFRNNPLIQEAHSIIRKAENEAQRVANHLWFGYRERNDWNNTPILQRFSKVKSPKSPYMVLKNLTDLEAHNVHELYKRGLEEGLSYYTTYDWYGSHLTQKEKIAYFVFSRAFKEQFTLIQNLEKILNKKNIIAYRTGWYPSVRNGDFFITIQYDGNLIYRQHFETKAAAEAWKNKMESKIPDEYSLGEIGNLKDNPQHPGMHEMIDIFAEYLDHKHNIQLFDVADEFKTKLATKGGKFGGHHEYRENILGYKGSELNLSPEESGRSFKEALIRNVDEFQSLYKTMLIKHKIDPMLINDVKEGDQTYAGIKQMRDSALNIIPNKVEAFDKAVYEVTDKIAKTLYESLFPTKEFAPTTAIYKTIQNNMIGLFYLFKVLPSASMFVTQLLSPLQAIRHAAYDGGLRSIASFGKGLYKLLSKDKVLMESLYDATQFTDIIEPQFIKTLHLQGENKVVEWLKDWIAMRKPQEAADVFSRVITYAFLHTHYRDVFPNLNKVEINQITRNGVDATMGAYSRGETAPVFKHLGGILGEGLRPLQTYGQMTVGNLVADIKHMGSNPTRLKAYAPFIMYGVISTIMGGAVSGVIMTQYETTRKLLMNINPQWELPSVIDLISTGVLSLDSIIEDPEAVTKLIAYGVLSSSTGIDIGASARTTETLPGNLLTVLLALTESENGVYNATNATSRLFPAHSNTIQMMHGGGVLGKKLLGGNVINSDLRQAITDVSMRGPMKNALMELTGANKTTVLGNKTNNLVSGAENKMSIPEGPKEKVAHWLGNLSTDERFHTDLKLEREFKERTINNRIKKLYTLYNENPKEQYLNELIELGATDKNIKSQLQTRSYNALVDQDIRFISNSRGHISNNPTTMRKLQGGLFRFGQQKESPN